MAVAIAIGSAVFMLRRNRKGFGNPIRALCGGRLQTEPPRLKKKPHNVAFGAVEGENRGTNPMKDVIHREDPYFYARDDSRTDKEILSHLRKENAYTAHKTKHLAGMRQNLYDEMLSHIQETDSSCPYPYGTRYLYYTRTEKGSSYTWHCRKEPEGPEEIVLDENALAKGLKHCEVGAVSPSPTHSLLAYSVDTTGYETYTLHFKDLKSGELINDAIEDTTGAVCWGASDKEVFYKTFDAAHRGNKVWRHVLGTAKEEDVCLHTEDDEQFRAFFGKSDSGRFLFLGSSSSETDEYFALDLTQPDAKPFCIQPRVQGMSYDVAHHGERFFIVTNRDATNFKLMETPITSPGMDSWRDVFAYDSKVKTDDVTCFSNHLVLSGREDGFSQVWVVALNDDGSMGEKHRIAFDESSYTVGLSGNRNFDTNTVRIVYESMTTPPSTLNYEMNTRTTTVLKRKTVPNYDPSLYACERLEAKHPDGTAIPMSVVYRKDKRTDGSGPRPLHLYGYGSYEISIDPDFRSTILPLLDRGVTYVIAHIRGGGEMGRSWYEDAKYLNKKKTFEDFVACAQFLVNEKHTSPSLMTCEGRSAGGLLMGAVLNMRPDLFVGAIAGVPFVDVLNTMCDATIPLTTGEWEEWGNPNEEKYFQYMSEYSPYDNVKAQDYPSVLVTSGLYDPRVAYWEPTKWVAKLRDLKTDNNDLLLKMDLDTGHFSASDRYHYLREKAFDTAFLLDKLGLVNETSAKL